MFYIAHARIHKHTHMTKHPPSSSGWQVSDAIYFSYRFTWDLNAFPRVDSLLEQRILQRWFEPAKLELLSYYRSKCVYIWSLSDSLYLSGLTDWVLRNRGGLSRRILQLCLYSIMVRCRGSDIGTLCQWQPHWDFEGDPVLAWGYHLCPCANAKNYL